MYVTLESVCWNKPQDKYKLRTEEIQHGVPQGSILGAVHKWLSNKYYGFTIVLFADSTNIFVIAENENMLKLKIKIAAVVSLKHSYDEYWEDSSNVIPYLAEKKNSIDTTNKIGHSYHL